MSRIVVCGSRDWTDEATIRKWLSALKPGTRVAHGGARGVDTIAGKVASELGFEVEVYEADWSMGRKAGVVRNAAMLQEEKPTRVVAFSFIDERAGELTRGTSDCVRRALVMGIPVTVVPGRRG